MARVSVHKVRTGFIDKKDWTPLTNAASVLSNAPIFIDDSPAISVLEMKARSRRLQSERGLSLVIVDYLQLMPGRTGRSEYRQQDISEITRSLKSMAKELKVPVIAISQLSRETEKRTSKRPQLSDLRESGAIEQDADLVAFIYREDYYDAKSALPGVTEIIIGKQRNGPTGSVKLKFLNEYTSFENLTKQPE
jgi:replicative DNA helicase